MKKLLLILLTYFVVSCGTLRWDTLENSDPMWSSYNYNQIHFIYTSNPGWFYNNYYIDYYGRTRYYHHHPYYVRYQKSKTRRETHNTHTRKSNVSTPIRRTNKSQFIQPQPQHNRSINQRNTRSNSQIQRTPTTRSTTTRRR